uniref:Uncharacterized protein n=1 Tax=Parascaris equorum TaxID=6256 RepID=A0A914R7F8_PAREQ
MRWHSMPNLTMMTPYSKSVTDQNQFLTDKRLASGFPIVVEVTPLLLIVLFVT